MKQWKLVLVALLAILLVCACGFSAIAEDQATCDHPESALEKKYTSDEELATCYGYKYYNVVCSKCGKVLSEGVKEDVKIEHKWGAWEVETPMACGVDKVEKRQCEKCLTIERKTTKAPAAHNFQVTFTSAATCEAAGYQVETCQNDVDGTQCGKTRTITLDKLPHVHNDDRDHWFATTEATCTVDGLMVNYCVNCGLDPIYKTIPATGHKFNGKVDADESVAKEATCTEAGSFEDQCMNEPNGVRCTAKQVTAIKALGHKLEENWTYNDSEKYPDCTHDLIGTKKCTRTDKIIYSANVQVETTAFEESLAKLDALVEEYGGWVESSSLNGSNYADKSRGAVSRRSASYTLRIPSDRFQELMSSLSDLGNIPYSHIYTENVTAQYYDVQARLTAYKTQEQRLLEMMELAETVEDVILLEDRLTEVRYSIESLQTSLLNWDRQVSFSSVYLDLNEVQVYSPEPQVQPSYGQRLATALKSGLRDFGDFFKELLIWLAGALPTLLLLGAIAAVVIVVVRKRKAGRKARKAAAAAAPAPKEEQKP